MISEPDRRAASTTTTPSDRPEMSRLRRGKSRARGSQPSGISEIAAPRAQDRVGEAVVLGRIDAVVPAGEHRDGAGRKARAMRGRVDAAGEARDDDEARLAEPARQPLGDLDAGGRGVARADDRHAWARARTDRLTAHGDQRWRIVDCREARRIGGFARGHQPDAQDCAARTSRNAASREDIRGARAAPPRRASSGSARRAAPALPQRARSSRNVRDPT